MSATREIAIVARKLTGKTGASRLILHQAVWLAERGWRVTLVGNRIRRELGHPGIRALRVPDLRIGEHLRRRSFDLLARLRVRTLGAPLVYGHSDILRQDVLGLHICAHKAHELLHGEPLTSADELGWRHETLLRGRRFRHLIANSRMMAQDVIERFQVPPELVTVIYPGYDEARYDTADKAATRAAICARWKLPPESLLVGFLTSGDFHNRNLGALLEALARLPAPERERVRCLVVGKDRAAADYERQAAALGLGRQVVFCGFQDDCVPYYKAFDLYVHPVLCEAFGMTILEAMACGAPVITTRTAGAAELFERELPELVLDTPADPERLGAAILDLLRDERRRREAGATLARLARPCRWQENFRQLDEVLERVWRERAGSGR